MYLTKKDVLIILYETLCTAYKSTVQTEQTET